MLNVRYVVFGHTHQYDIEALPSLEGAEYFNVGTWTKVFDDREARLIREQSELAFLEVWETESGPRAELLRWEDASRSVRRVKVFRTRGR